MLSSLLFSQKVCFINSTIQALFIQTILTAYRVGPYSLCLNATDNYFLCMILIS